jgi:anti-sigma factor RsiW
MTTPNELSCQELVELITAYLEGALPQTEHARFERHLEECPGCRNYLGQMRRTIALLGSLPKETVAPEAWQSLLRAFRTWNRG